MTQIAEALYTARTHTTGGRDGTSRSADGRLDIKLSPPDSAGAGTNPEQLFAAGWSACFQGAMGRAARRRKVALPADLAIDAEVDLGMAGDEYFLRARLNVSLPGLDRELARAILDAAHRICPYSKATRGNIDVPSPSSRRREADHERPDYRRRGRLGAAAVWAGLDADFVSLSSPGGRRRSPELRIRAAATAPSAGPALALPRAQAAAARRAAMAEHAAAPRRRTCGERSSW